MSTQFDPSRRTDAPMIYQIRLRGHLTQDWEAWFDGFEIQLQANGDTLLTGAVADQSALHGLFKRIRDIGMPLISVNHIEPGSAT